MSPEEKVGALLREKEMKISVAESCTGGLLAKLITDIAGASDYFEMGVITYSNRAKETILGVPGELLARMGAVSNEVAAAMADGVRRLASADISLSVTGIAGPGGGTPEKPVGTVFVGLAWAGKSHVRKFLFQGDRGEIRAKTAEEALNLLYACLKGELE
ncbi:MAG TPA: nicotinamide-nucleotide amidohydrolase family protein [Syntrophorhabdaceae bacterium]|jgi:nicotinamide-nucleotide amidase